MTTLRSGPYDMAGNTIHTVQEGLVIAGLSVALSVVTLPMSTPAVAQESTWLAGPGSNFYIANANWNPIGAPINAGDIAVFGQSDTTLLTINAAVTVDAWVFNAGADNYLFTNDQTLTFVGDGITVNGGIQEIDNSAGGTLNFNFNSGAGDVFVINEGNVVFTHNSSAENAAVDNNANIIFGYTATAANSHIRNNLGGVLEFQGLSTAGNADITNYNEIQFQNNSSAGSATIANAVGGELYFADESTAGGATIGNAGRIRFVDGSTAGTATIANIALATETLFFGDSSAGNATLYNDGLLGFAANSTAADAAITNFGLIQWIDNSSAGNATIANNGLVQLSGAASLGHARLINDATATVDISALLGVFGTTVGSIEGAGDIILGGRDLFTGLNGLSTEFSGDISGTGTLVKQGTGVLTLSGVNTYSGSTFVNGGALIVNGSIASSADVNINAGGTLGGEGTVSDVLVAGGAVAPGNSIGTLNVAGNVTFDPGSTYEVEVNSLGQSDLIDATGTASLNGGTVEVVPFPDYAIDTQYTILTAAGGVGGSFDGVDFTDTSLFLTPTLAYGANDVFLTIAQTADFDSAALTPNQIAAAGGAQSLGGGELFNAIAVLGTEDEARAAFDAISGEIHASAKTALLKDSRFVREAANARLGVAGEGLGFWTQAFGASGHIDSDGNAAALDRSIGGIFIGADGEVLEGWQAGVLAGYSRSSFSADDRASSGSADSYHLGAYGGTEWNDFAARFGGTYSWHDLEVSRAAAFTGFSDSLSSSYSAGTGQLFGEVSYGMDVDTARLEPFANLAWVNHATDGFTENGGAAALAGADDVINATFATLGLRASTQLVMGEAGRARLSGMIGWRHAFGDTPTATNTFVAGGDAFTVTGVPLARDALVLEAGLDLDIAPEATLGFAYSGQVGSGISDHGIKANLGVRF